MRNLTLATLLLTGAMTAAAAAPVHQFKGTAKSDLGPKPALSLSQLKSAKAAPQQLLEKRAQAQAHKLTGAKKSALKRVLTDNPPTDMVTEVDPNLPSELMTKTGIGFVYSWFGIQYQASNGSLTEVVRDGDKVYVGNAWSLVATDGYLVGTVEGNKVTFELPQLIEHIVYDFGEDGYYEFWDYAVAAEMYDYEEDGEIYSDFAPCESQTVTYTIDENGMWVADNPEIFIGEYGFEAADPEYDIEAEWYWDGGGDYIDQLLPLTAKPVTLPEGLAMDNWTLINGITGAEVKVGFDGDLCYIQGFGALAGPDVADSVVVGEVKDGKVTLASGQYLGECWSYGFTTWFQGGHMESVYDEDWEDWYDEFFVDDALVLDYDAEAKTLKTDKTLALSLSEPCEYLYGTLTDFTILKPSTDVVTSVPAPVLYNFWDFEDEAEVDFLWATVNADGVLLDESKLFFQIFLDDEPLTFYADEYPGLEEDTDMLPVGFISEDEESYEQFANAYGNQQSIMIFPVGYDLCQGRLVYVDGDNVVYSDKTNFYIASGVASLQAGKAVHYYDLQGRKLSAPVKGLQIRAVQLPDGSLRHDKVIL